MLDRLNPAQRAAASAPDGATLVIAGAGTGKTQTLVHRVAWLIDQGVPPEGIVLLTFTRRAAAEMLERAAKLAGPQAKRVRGGTFHAFANTMLRRHARTLGYTAGFSVLDQEDATRLVATSRAAAGLAGKDRGFLTAAPLASLWSLHRNTDRSLAEIVAELQPEHTSDTQDIERLMRSCDTRRKKLDVMDYDDLLVRFAELLFDHDAARRAVAGPIRHVLVDEYQDTNRLQARIAAALSSEHGNLMVVGDEAQSIYAFRGASVRNILDFPKMFEGCRPIVLEQSYRSTTRILDLANAVLASAAEGFEKRLTSSLGAGELPEILEAGDEEEQADEVVRRAVAAHRDGVPWSEIAVLVRAGFHSNLVEVELTRRRIPFKKYGGLKFTDAAHTKDVLALLRVVANPRDELSWLRILSTLEGVGDKTATKLAADAVAVGRLDPVPHRARKWGSALAHLAATIEAAGTDAPADRAKRLVDWYRPALERLHDEPQRRAKDLETLELLAGRATDLQGFLADLALDPPLASEAGKEDDDEDDVLVISTIHSAKGLEWRVVFLLNLADGAFPSGQALDDRERLEEERRLLYVAVTRAKQQLVLGRPWSTRGRGWDDGGSCRLLDDLSGLERLTRPAKGGQKRASERGSARMEAFRDFFGQKRR